MVLAVPQFNGLGSLLAETDLLVMVPDYTARLLASTGGLRYEDPPEELRAARPGLVVLPDEPYRFTADDGPEAFPGLPCALVDGRCLTWYGPSLAEAPRVLGAALRAALR